MFCVSLVRVTPPKCVPQSGNTVIMQDNEYNENFPSSFYLKDLLPVMLLQLLLCFIGIRKYCFILRTLAKWAPPLPPLWWEGVIVFSPRGSLYTTGVNSTLRAVFPEKHSLPSVVQNDGSVCPSASHFTFDHDSLSVIAFTYTRDVSQGPNLLRLGF